MIIYQSQVNVVLHNGNNVRSSVYHRRISVFTKSAKYKVSVYRPGGEVNSTIYCSDID